MIISMETSSCGDGSSEELEFCRDDAAAFRLKLAAFAAILVAGVAGVAIPLVVGWKRRFLNGEGGSFVCAKAFAAGVILATGFVHMLHDGQEALTNPCLPWSVWQRFPFAGFTAMLAALGTLAIDFLGTQYYERKHRMEATGAKAEASAGAAACHADDETGITVALLAPEATEGKEARNEVDRMHIVGMHAHAAEHRHSHPHIHGACKGPGHSRDHAQAHGRHDSESGLPPRVRHEVVSQILELGIVSHSVIIGLSLGVSRSPCTIRPLIAALSFHQFFEGFALGGCISQAQFRNLATVTMACFFAITTPAGIAAGASAASFYDSNSPRALVAEGLLDSVSAGILIYMALVDLIAADFMSHRMSCNLRLQVASYISLFVGAVAMSAIALWA